ncbi:prepilin-type N-terminal cleavage/methylation domain-containing protein [Halanaerobium sp. Z-7514]|uniref:Prepilin-type N-terminal cleavage/methylation domain-containing protein n=1 Tax=Halanaerobium polyolivorans TaxID=2886943 RepID=A0AAW4WYK0_9FIRM|nr:prepilin-type N-terminal cleavage/methylation domain-containing protein [Halanaerobium polyolivorans]MCC3143724.1 prepilin-type N-terminal cleavage/methylation domain-containing protein [Halanaerobium polyolivorans]
MNLRREEAFTLIEIIVAITVFTIVLLALSNILINGWRFWDFNQKSVDLSQATTLISANLDRNIRSSRGFSQDNIEELMLFRSSNNETSKENFFKFVFEDNRIVLYKPATDPDTLVLTDIDNWEFNRNITDAVVSAAEFELNGSFVDYTITLENNRKSITVNNKIRSRLQ